VKTRLVVNGAALRQTRIAFRPWTCDSGFD